MAETFSQSDNWSSRKLSAEHLTAFRSVTRSTQMIFHGFLNNKSFDELFFNFGAYWERNNLRQQVDECHEMRQKFLVRSKKLFFTSKRLLINVTTIRKCRTRFSLIKLDWEYTKNLMKSDNFQRIVSHILTELPIRAWRRVSVSVNVLSCGVMH